MLKREQLLFEPWQIEAMNKLKTKSRTSFVRRAVCFVILNQKQFAKLPKNSDDVSFEARKVWEK